MNLTVECRCGFCTDLETLNPHPKACPRCGRCLAISGTDIPLYVAGELNPWLFDDSSSVDSYHGPRVSNEANIRVVLWHGTTQETHLADSYAAAMDLVDERHQNVHDPAFYDLATGERLYDGGYGLATEAGEIRFS